MSVLFLTNHYFPTPNANGVCIGELAKQTYKQGYSTHVICYNRQDGKSEEIMDGIAIHRLRMPLYSRFYDLSKRKKWYSLFLYHASRAISLFEKVLKIKEYPLQSRSIVNQYVSKCLSVLTGQGKDVIIATYTPYEAIKAALIVKSRLSNVKIVYYSLDTLSNEGGRGVLPLRVRQRLGEERECECFEKYDQIVLMRCHENHYLAGRFSPFVTKIRYVDFPLFLPEKSHEKNSINKGTIVYAGSLYREIRNPGPVLSSLSPFMSDFIFHFYGDEGDCADIMAEYERKFPGHIIRHGLVPYAVAQKALMAAECLLSIGNSNTDMTPSKIYEYISTGKPILHAFSSSKDYCLSILSQYSNAYCLNVSRVELSTLQVFMNNLHQISFSDDYSCFREATAQYTIDIFLDRE